MSHISHITLAITDLAALKSACREHGLVFNEGDTAYKCWTQSLIDLGLDDARCKRMCESMKTPWEDRPRSVHSISLPGAYEQIGVFKTEKGYSLGYDNWAPNGKTQLREKLGAGLEKLKQAYGIAKATIEAKAKGWMVKRHNLSNGSVKLVVTGVN